MADEAWDAFAALPEPEKREAIRFLNELVVTGGAGIPEDPWGRFSVVLRGNLAITFERREVPEPHLWVFPPIRWTDRRP